MKAQSLYSYCFLFFFTNLVLTHKLQADYLFPAGTDSKVVGLANCVDNIGAYSTLYNPSNLNFSNSLEFSDSTQDQDQLKSKNFDLGVELDVFSLRHIYEHPFNHKIEMRVQSPISSIGLSYKINDRLYVGGIIFPDKYVNINIDDLPQKMFSNYTVDLAVSMKEFQINSGLGVSYRISGIRSDIGLALSGIYEKTKLKISTVDKATVINSLDAHSFNPNFILGIHSNITRFLDLSFSYIHRVIKRFKGDSDFILDENDTQKITDFIPSIMSLGLSLKLPYSLFLSMQSSFYYWSAGDNYISNKYSNIMFVSAIKNTFNHFILLRKKIFSSIFSLGFSFIQSPWLDGSFSEDPTDFTVGTDFTKLDNVDRFTVGMSYSKTLASFVLKLVGSYSYGHRLVDMNGYNPGKYYTKLFMAGMELSYTF